MLRLPRFEFFKARSLTEALSALGDQSRPARILAGGTDLLVNMKYGLAQPKVVVSIRSLPELSHVAEDGDGSIHIGSCAGLSELSANSLIAEKLPALRNAVASVASQHIRNMATLGGNICLDTRCWYYNQSKTWRQGRAACHRTGGNLCHAVGGSARCHAINSSDTAPILIALDASLVIAGKDGSRTVACRDFYRDDGAQHAQLGPGEILKEIIVPVRDTARHATFIKVSKRRGIDFAMGSIAALVTADSGRCSAVKLIIGSLCSAPRVLEKAARSIMDEGLSDASIEKAADAARPELGVLTNLFTSAGYKRDLAHVLVRRALHEQKKQLKNQGELHQ